MGAGTYYSSRIKFFGYNLKKLKEITADLEKTLRRNPRIKEVRTVSSRYGWWRGDTVEDVLKIDKAALRRYDIDPAYLYFNLQTMIQGELRPAGPDPDGRQGHHRLGQVPRRVDARHARPARSPHPDARRRVSPARRDRRLRRGAHRRLDRPREPAVPADDHVGVPRPVQGRGALPQGRLRLAPPAAGLLGDPRRAAGS